VRSVLAALLVTSVVALAAPAHAGEDWGRGLTCAFDGAGQADSDEVTGVLSGGPWQAPAGATARVTCVLQVVHEGQTQVVAVAQSPQGTTAVVQPTIASFHDYAAATAPILQLCTEVTVYKDGQPPRVRRYDADHDPRNGAQCDQAGAAQGSGTRVYVVPPHDDGDPCVWVDHSDVTGPNDPGNEVCVPYGPL
jgi:hypothetical protein